jgi:hypothetical protein
MSLNTDPTWGMLINLIHCIQDDKNPQVWAQIALDESVNVDSLQTKKAPVHAVTMDQGVWLEGFN